MNTTQAISLIFINGGCGWLISWLTIQLLFFSGLKKSLAFNAGRFAQKEFLASHTIEEKIADPALLEKLKPDIEQHVDHFLNKKLSEVFPLFYKFMGEKTLLQFKNAFLAETDILFPAIIRRYAAELKQELRIDLLIADKINSIPAKTIKKAVYKNKKKQIIFYQLICICVGLLLGCVNVAVLLYIDRS